MKTALITGITGQDGSYLAEFLLEKGYDVHGIIRRSSSFNTGRIEHLYMDDMIKDIHTKKIKLHYGDMNDASNLTKIVAEVKPDEIYNLAAQSHVQVSFETPEYTGDVDGLGTLRLLEAVKMLGLEKTCRIYQASTSELYGKVQEIPQSETTPFYPRSPYGVAKLYAYWIMKNYRESYDMFTANGILFNHETIAEFMPIIFKEGKFGYIDIKPINEVVKYHTRIGDSFIDTTIQEYQEGKVDTDLYIWDKNDWTKVKFASGYPTSACKTPKNPKYINSRSACYMATDTHDIIMEDGSEKNVKDIKIGDKVSLTKHPKLNKHSTITIDEATLLGFMVADGFYSNAYHGIRFTNTNDEYINEISQLWKSFGGNVKITQSTGGFENSRTDITQVNMNGNSNFFKKYQMYTEDRHKRIPIEILNSSPEVMIAFLTAYNKGDGLKSGYKVNYTFKNFKTNSATLAAGLLFIIQKTTGQEFNITLDESYKWGDQRIYYSLNLLKTSDSAVTKYHKVNSLLSTGISQRQINRDTGISRTFIRKVSNGYIPPKYHHKRKYNNEVKKIIDMNEYNGWFYDLETESGTFHCGIGFGHVHNSPRRGESFVTRKITLAMARMHLGLQDTLYLGNLNAKRDWGHAKDYVECMWKILQHDTPDDFVIATGEMHTVREFVEAAYDVINGSTIRWEGEGVDEKGYNLDGDCIIAVDPKYFRPAEVEQLLGDPTKAKTLLNWNPTQTTFKELVADMVMSDLDKVMNGKI